MLAYESVLNMFLGKKKRCCWDELERCSDVTYAFQTNQKTNVCER